jgi:hypothetical protein
VRTICIPERTLAFLRAFLPEAIIYSAISPLTKSLTSHLALDPLALILPALNCADKEALALLEPVHIFTLIEVTVLPFADAAAVWEAVLEFSQVNFAFRED